MKRSYLQRGLRALRRQWRAHSGRSSPWSSEEVIRLELFGPEQLDQHAVEIAVEPLTGARKVRVTSLTDRLEENAAVLKLAVDAISRAVRARRDVTPAAEWLLDNYYLIEAQIAEVSEDLPPDYSRQLPRLRDGLLAGYPRVLEIAWEYVAHTDSHFEPDSLRRFVQSYQSVQALTIGELWAVAITLRIVLIENLRRAADRITGSRTARLQADEAVDRLLGLNGHLAEAGSLEKAFGAREQNSRAFLVQVLQRLRDQDPQATPALQWLELHLADQQESAEAIIHLEHQRQAGSNLTVRNIITSLRRVAEVDWSEFFESVSLVDRILSADPTYQQMDFVSRNLYRNVIEEISRGSARSEVQIATAALGLAALALAPRERESGYYLLAAGRAALEQSVGFRLPKHRYPANWFRKSGAAPYVGSILLLASGLVLAPLISSGVQPVQWWMLLLLCLFALPAALDVAVALVNRIVMQSYGATLLPGLELREGIGPALRTLVAVPAMLGEESAIAELIERLEVHHLSSQDGDVSFALLTDWRDSEIRELPEDASLLAAAVAGIAALNQRYPAGAAGPRFLLLHRRRTWSSTQQLWMGWERKRGKLHELNRLLRGAADTSYMPNGSVPSAVRYIVTLDADTRLSRGAVRRLVGKMSHPINQPRFDPDCGRVVEGYGVLQPRVTAALPETADDTAFLRVTASAAGIDPYAAAASDVYQDLFGEGSYAGKGIYDIDAFEASLAARTADGTLLSHDLFEGLFARAGLVSDIEVVENFPSRYDAAMTRAHRWARGDWQLLPWLLGRRIASPARGERRIPALGYWKMIDNLRRTLSAPAMFAALVLAWSMPWQSALPWVAFVLLTVIVPTALPILAACVRRRADITFASQMRALAAECWLAAKVCLLRIAFLADQGWVMGDAVARTLFRMAVSRRRLLDWIPAAQFDHFRPRLRIIHGGMAGGFFCTVLAAVVLLPGASPGTWWLAAPVLGLWAAAPLIATLISTSWRASAPTRPSAADRGELRVIARRTWRYFESFVTAEDHMLPPDNFQQLPRDALAHRTSPTNIGLYLLATVSARDMGWIGATEAANRLEATLRTMSGLQRYRGHFLNWYETRDLRALEPLYVSTVDSGNLAAHLVTLAQAVREWSRNLDATNAAGGCLDALRLMALASLALPSSTGTQSVLRRLFDSSRQQLEQQLDALGQATAGASAAAIAMLVSQAASLADIARTLANEEAQGACDDLIFWADAVQQSAECWARELNLADAARAALQGQLLVVAEQASRMAHEMQFGFLLDAQRKLFRIGYRIADGMQDPGCYDLLASEARLASFFAISKGDVDARHWFRLGRPFAPAGNAAVLLSWSGSMFEYLMPGLVMKVPRESLLGCTARLAVRQQQRYGLARGIPWGISESAYDARDTALTYQYSNFGVPGLGLRRGLGDAMVVAPYATALAAMLEPEAAMQNFRLLESLGAVGRYGFFESLDFTRKRLREDVPFALVCTFMAHHQGMTIIAIANVVQQGLMCDRFHSLPQIRATELLLQERSPVTVSAVQLREVDLAEVDPPAADIPAAVRRSLPLRESALQVQLLSNERYSVMLSGAASGYSQWGEVAISRWRADSTCDDMGSYVYLRDLESGRLWSPGCQPLRNDGDHYETLFSQERAQFLHRESRITTTMEVVVSPEEDAEVRLITISNHSGRTHEIEITSVVELVLASPGADSAHMAFSKLFVRTELESRLGAVLATRRQRESSEATVWAAHQLIADEHAVGNLECETDRCRFLGRGRDMSAPLALYSGQALSGTTGTVLDPVFVLRQRLRVPAGATAKCTLWTAAAATREQLVQGLERHRDASSFQRASTLAWTHAQVQLRHLGISAAEANVFQQLAGHLLYPNAMFRPPSAIITRGSANPTGLWSLGISGDLPILLLRVDAVEDIAVARQLLQAHEYWSMKLLQVDLVILNERPASYLQDLQAALEVLVRTRPSHGHTDDHPRRGSVHMLRIDLLAPAVAAQLSAAASVVLLARHGSLADQLERRHLSAVSAVPRNPHVSRAPEILPGMPPTLEFFNGLGGFAADGREYVVLLNPGQHTPAPWINVIANSQFGFHVAAEGSGYTWAGNSRENQLTPWSNDPVSDRSGECIYLQDEADADLWSPTLAPLHDAGSFHTAAHGQGYSRFSHESRGIALQLLTYVPLEDPLRISRLLIRNTTGRTRFLVVTAYAEWVLGQSRSVAAPHVITSMDADTGAMFARNPWSLSFAPRVAFMDLCGVQTSWTGDRSEFLGRYGSVAAPQALVEQIRLSGRTGAGLDPCCAMQHRLVLEPGASIELVQLFGQAANEIEARQLLHRYRTLDLDAVYREVTGFWDDTLGKVQVRTPDRAMDLLLNRWALYQTLSCRYWARAAFYQASGAFGFRDQLQDAMALVIAHPTLTREHILRAAGRQFSEGDVQHWWQPHSGVGVRTRISDDRVWLVFAVAHYVRTTGDRSILDEALPFLAGPLLMPGAADACFVAGSSEEVATLYEHCARALELSMATGSHGLPLIGTGDWNDGMNRVGEQGRGESVWLGWFLHATLADFLSVCSGRQSDPRMQRWRTHMGDLKIALEASGWDGQWYRRGFFDDGSPLGSAANSECRIDSIAQSWSVLSGAAEPARSRQAMDEVDAQLVRRTESLALLFTPPFANSQPDPGYIQGYPPGIRENGGQYTHAAAWTVMACAALGQGDKAAELFGMINPVNRATTRAAAHRYKVEPYVVAADVYSVAPHSGRGGWTWYTGSAGWLYRAGMESILGFRLAGNRLSIAPCIPKQWQKYEIAFRYRSSRYEIVVENPGNVCGGAISMTLDGNRLAEGEDTLELLDDGITHHLRVILSAV